MNGLSIKPTASHTEAILPGEKDKKKNVSHIELMVRRESRAWSRCKESICVNEFFCESRKLSFISSKCVFLSKWFDKTSWEKAAFARPLLCALVPEVGREHSWKGVSVSRVFSNVSAWSTSAWSTLRIVNDHGSDGLTYHPSSRFLCTKTTSPTLRASSYSLLGGYGTMQRNLSETKEKINMRMKRFHARSPRRPAITVLTSPAAWVEFYFFEQQIRGLPPSPMRRECGSNRRSLR